MTVPHSFSQNTPRPFFLPANVDQNNHLFCWRRYSVIVDGSHASPSARVIQTCVKTPPLIEVSSDHAIFSYCSRVQSMCSTANSHRLTRFLYERGGRLLEIYLPCPSILKAVVTASSLYTIPKSRIAGMSTYFVRR